MPVDIDSANVAPQPKFTNNDSYQSAVDVVEIFLDSEHQPIDGNEQIDILHKVLKNASPSDEEYKSAPKVAGNERPVSVKERIILAESQISKIPQSNFRMPLSKDANRLKSKVASKLSYEAVNSEQLNVRSTLSENCSNVLQETQQGNNINKGQNEISSGKNTQKSLLSKMNHLSSECEDSSSISTDQSLSQNSISDDSLLTKKTTFKSDTIKNYIKQIYDYQEERMNFSQEPHTQRNDYLKMNAYNLDDKLVGDERVEVMIENMTLTESVASTNNLADVDGIRSLSPCDSVKVKPQMFQKNNNAIGCSTSNFYLAKAKEVCGKPPRKYITSISVGSDEAYFSEPESTLKTKATQPNQNTSGQPLDPIIASQIVSFTDESSTIKRARSMFNVGGDGNRGGVFIKGPETRLNYANGSDNDYRVSLRVYSGLSRSFSQINITETSDDIETIRNLVSLTARDVTVRNNSEVALAKTPFESPYDVFDNNQDNLSGNQLTTLTITNQNREPLGQSAQSNSQISNDQLVDFAMLENNSKPDNEVIYSVVGVKGRHRSTVIPRESESTRQPVKENSKNKNRSVCTEKDWIINLDISKLIVDSIYPTTCQTFKFHRLPDELVTQPEIIAVITPNQKPLKHKGTPPLLVNEQYIRPQFRPNSTDNEEEIIMQISAGFVHVISRSVLKESGAESMLQQHKKKRRFSWGRSYSENPNEIRRATILLVREIHVDMTANFNRKLLYEKIAASTDNLTNSDIANLSKIFFALVEIEKTKMPKRTAFSNN